MFLTANEQSVQPIRNLAEATIDFLIEYDVLMTEAVDAEFASIALTEADEAEKELMVSKTVSTGRAVWEAVKKFVVRLAGYIAQFGRFLLKKAIQGVEAVRKMFAKDEGTSIAQPDQAHLDALLHNANIGDGETGVTVPAAVKGGRITGAEALDIVNEYSSVLKEVSDEVARVGLELAEVEEATKVGTSMTIALAKYKVTILSKKQRSLTALTSYLNTIIKSAK